MEKEIVKRIETELEKEIIVIKEEYSDETYTEFALSKDKTQLLKCKTNNSKVEIPSSVTDLGFAAFEFCRHLLEITIPDSVIYIDRNVFADCSVLKRITIPNSVTYIGNGAFRNCKELKITIPDSVTYIGEEAFRNCKELKITIPDSVTYIGEEAFNGCIQPSEITIPDSVTNIGEDPFGRWKNLKKIYYRHIKFGIEEGFPSFENVPELYTIIINALKKNPTYNITLIDDNKLEISNNSDISIIFNEILKKIPKENISSLSEYLSVLNLNTFTNNIELLKNSSLSNQEIVETIAYGNNYGLLNIPIEIAIKNYEYLVNQNKISKLNLDKIIFGDITGETFMEKIISYHHLFGSLPESLKTLMTQEEIQLELRDRLEYISISCVQNETLNYNNAKLMFNRTLFENITEYDKENFNKIDSENGLKILNNYPQMKGILEHFYEKLNGIDENWYNELIVEITKDNNTTFNDFFNSLNTIKNWEKIPDEKERATKLKNELIGKLLYTKISYLCTKHNLENAKNTKLRKIFNSTYIPIGELLKLATLSENGKTVIKKQVGFDNVKKTPIYEYKENKPNLGIINKLLEIDPYAFDMFKNEQSPSEIEIVLAALAKNNGYLFTEQEIETYLKKLKEINIKKTLKEFSDYKTTTLNQEEIKELFTMSNTKTHFKEYLSNKVGIPKIPTENKSEYLKKVRVMAKSYANNNNTEELINFTSALDLYLRANSEYIFQSRKNDQESVSKLIFDRDSSIDNNSKILYSLYNLNKLAHNSSEIHLLSYLENKHRLSKEKQAETTNKLQSAINSYISLSKYGLTSEQINILLTGKYDYTDSSKVFSKGEIYSLNQFLTTEKLPILDNDEIDLIEKIKTEEENNEIEQTTLFPEDEEKLKQAQIQKQIKKYFSKIATLSDKEKIQLNNYVEEAKTFYECKQIFAQEIMNKLTKNIANKFENIMFASIEIKQKFYAENGFIAEIQFDQSDDKNLVLACLSEKFKEPFSVHLKDLDEETKQRFINNIKEPTISHVKLHGSGLTLRDEEYNNSIRDLTLDKKENIGFYDSYNNINQVKRNNYEIYDLPAKKIREEKIKEQQNKEKRKEVEILLFEDEHDNSLLPEEANLPRKK